MNPPIHSFTNPTIHPSTNPPIHFHRLPLGARFEFRGRRYEKLALSLARDEDRCGNVFQDETEVLWHRRPDENPAPPRPHSPSLPWPYYLSPAHR